MGPDTWRSFTDPPFLGDGIVPGAPATPGVPFLQLLPGILSPLSQAAERITAQQQAAAQARAVLSAQTKIEMAKIEAETKRSEAESKAIAVAAASGKPLPPRAGNGKLPAWVIPVAIGGAALFLLSGLFRRKRK